MMPKLAAPWYRRPCSAEHLGNMPNAGPASDESRPCP